MKTNYIKQIVYDMLHHPMVTWVNILGTAMAIFLLMVVVQMNSIYVEPFRPESNRDRILYVSVLGVEKKKTQGLNVSPISYKTIQRLYADLPGCETVTAYNWLKTAKGASLQSQRPISVTSMEVDDNFFAVYDLKFINGKPFDKTMVGAERGAVVISESVARRLFGTTDVVGKQMLLDYAPYTVSGVVEDVSSLAKRAYADVWFSLSSMAVNESYAHILGTLSATILAKSRSKFPEIREEIHRRTQALENEINESDDIAILDNGQPFDQETLTAGIWNNNIDEVRRNRYLLYAILLIVPAINIASMTNSRMRQRLCEMAVMRSYGCTRFGLMRSLVAENMIVTLCAGVIGLVASILFSMVAPEFLFAQTNAFGTAYTNNTVDMSMLFHWSTFFNALLFCFILNLLSTGVPAWAASRLNIINSLRGTK